MRANPEIDESGGTVHVYYIEVWGMAQKNFEILCHERASGAI